MQDRTIECEDCKRGFPFTRGEQEFFKQKGLSEPKRCKTCRKIRKEKRGY